MDSLDLEDMLVAMESLGASTGRKRKKLTGGTPALSRDDAWAKLNHLLATHDADGNPLRAETEPVSRTSPEPASAQVHEAGSTSLFSAPEPAPGHGSGGARSGPGLSGPARRCSATTRSGGPCRAFARTGGDRCFAHDSGSRDDFIASSAAAGQASGEARRKRAAYDLEHLSLHCGVGLQVALDAIFRLELTGQLPPQRTRSLIRLLAIASRGVDRTADIDPEAFGALREALDEQLPEVVDAQRLADIYREVRRVENQQMERGQLAVDLDRYPQLDRRPASSRKLDIAANYGFRSARDHPDFR